MGKRKKRSRRRPVKALPKGVRSAHELPGSSPHTHRSSFNWQSTLSDERKDEIIAWQASLDANQRKMLQETIEDVEADTADSLNPDL